MAIDLSTDDKIALTEAAIAALERIVETVAAARSGKVSPAAAIASLQDFASQLAEDNAAAESALDARFPKG